MRSLSATRPSFLISCSLPPPAPCSKLPPRPGTWERKSVSPPCCTPGDRTSCFILTYTVWSPVADSPQMASPGSPPERDSSCRSLVLGRLFRGKFLAALRQAYEAGQLKLAGSTAELSQPRAWRQFLDPLYKKNWVVYAKPPFASPEYVFRYLGRYTHRVAISNQRILAF